MFERISALVPYPLRFWLKKEIRFAGFSYDTDRFAGFIFLMGIVAAVIGFVTASQIMKLDQLYSTGVFFGCLGAIFIGAIFWVTSAADGRGSKVERILPDALQLIASNIKAGLTTEKSLFVSARPEFGALSTALKEASKKIMVGERLEKALLEIPHSIKSTVLERTMWLIAEGIRNGGQIASLLLQLSTDLREENALKEEVNSNTGMYVMLIFASAAFGAPMLFGISSFIVGVLSSQTANIGIDPAMMADYSSKNPALGLIGIPTSTISEGFITMFSIIVLIVTSIFTSMVLGVINSGSEKKGFKYFPLLLVLTIVLFFVVRTVVSEFFGKFAMV
ncbi:MAG: type II secretion system F family protein [Candidatus Diapherotrites archaeon]|nr:type II secretion system F family protein [Candidatus Diapherotrites archaeon]